MNYDRGLRLLFRSSAWTGTSIGCIMKPVINTLRVQGFKDNLVEWLWSKLPTKFSVMIWTKVGISHNIRKIETMGSGQSDHMYSLWTRERNTWVYCLFSNYWYSNKFINEPIWTLEYLIQLFVMFYCSLRAFWTQHDVSIVDVIEAMQLFTGKSGWWVFIGLHLGAWSGIYVQNDTEDWSYIRTFLQRWSPNKWSVMLPFSLGLGALTLWVSNSLVQ